MNHGNAYRFINNDDKPGNWYVSVFAGKNAVNNFQCRTIEDAYEAARIIKTRSAADATPSKAVERLRAALMRREGKSYEELQILRQDFRALKDDPKALKSLLLSCRFTLRKLPGLV